MCMSIVGCSNHFFLARCYRKLFYPYPISIYSNDLFEKSLFHAWEGLIDASNFLDLSSIIEQQYIDSPNTGPILLVYS